MNTTLIVAAVMWVASAALPAPAAERPSNIVFLLADDLRWDGLGCTGNTVVKTPNIDSLAARGVLFRNHFVTTSICCVSRASMFSGQYARRHKIDDFKTNFTPAAFAQTYPALLRAAGYRTGFIGKYGVGDAMPEKEFDYWRGFPGQGRYLEKNKPGHLTAKMGDQALEFLAGDATKPFCLSLSFKAPHAQDGAAARVPARPARREALRQRHRPGPEARPIRSSSGCCRSSCRSPRATRRWKRRYATPEHVPAERSATTSGS